MEKQFLKKLEDLNACEEAMEWLQGVSSIEEAYEACDRGDWLLWLAGRLGIDRKLIVLAACECAEQVLKYVPAGEGRPRKAIDTARAWARGEADIEEVQSAASAYASAAYAAAASDAAAASAASAAAYAAAASDAYAASADAYADAADASAARASSLKKSAEITRKHISLDVFMEALCNEK